MRISAKSQYGLRAMVYLAKFKDKISSLKEISEKEGVPFDYLEKIMSKLEKVSLVNSKKGAGGGYSLARSPQKITVGEIMRALEGKMALVKCVAEEKKERFSCPRKKICLTKNVWGKIQEIINSTLNSISLADLIKEG